MPQKEKDQVSDQREMTKKLQALFSNKNKNIKIEQDIKIKCKMLHEQVTKDPSK